MINVDTASLLKAMRTRTFLRDAVFALLGAIFFTLQARNIGFSPQLGNTTATAALWSLLIWLPLAWRRVAPVPAGIAIAVISAIQLLTGYLLLPADIAVLIMIYSASVYAPKWAGRAGLAVAVVGSIFMGYSIAPDSQGAIVADSGIYDFLILAALTSTLAVTAWALGLMRRARRETIVALKSRATTLEERAQQLEFERDQQRIIATQAERARIAREMHDIVAHSLSIMIVQADGGRYVAATNPEAASEVLGTISETGRSALKEMRRLLGILRSDDEIAAGPVMAPLPGNVTSAHPETGGVPMLNSGLFPAGLEDLFAQARSAGMPLKVSTSGPMRELVPSAALTLQRVCQESLTNIRKHAGPGAQARVELEWLPREVQLTVSDNGNGSAGGVHDPGFGLIGLNERASLVDGTFSSGPKPGGGWETKFTMPL